MAGTITDYAKHAVLNHVLRGVALPTLPASLYAGLFTAAPTDAGGGTEVPLANGYSRKTITRGTGQWSAPATNGVMRQVVSATAIAYNDATAGWGTVVGIGFFDAATAGNLWFYMDLATARAVDAGESAPTIPGGTIIAQLGGHASNFLRDAVLNWIFRGVTFPTLSASLYAALYSVTPTASTAGIEFTIGSGAYARSVITRGTGAWDSPAGGVTQNTGAIAFATPTTAWGTYDGLGLLDAATAGNLLIFGDTVANRSIAANDNPPTVAAGAWDVVFT